MTRRLFVRIGPEAGDQLVPGRPSLPCRRQDREKGQVASLGRAAGHRPGWVLEGYPAEESQGVHDRAPIDLLTTYRQRADRLLILGLYSRERPTRRPALLGWQVNEHAGGRNDGDHALRALAPLAVAGLYKTETSPLLFVWMP